MSRRQMHSKVWMIAILSVILLLSACSNNSSSNRSSSSRSSDSSSTSSTQSGGQQATADPETRNHITILTNTFATEPMKKDDPYFQKLEELTGFDIDVQWIPETVYNDRLTAVMAGGELADLVKANHFSPAVYNAVKAGMFWDVGPYFKEFPNLSQLDPKLLDLMRIDGGLHGFYRARPISREGIVIRQDWLDNLNLSQPNTFEELDQVIRAFAKGDPDQNGKDDTYPFLGDLRDVKQMLIIHGVAQRWHLNENGEIVAYFMTDQFKDVLRYMRGLHEENLVPSDFLMQTWTEEYNRGKVGIAMISLDNIDKSFTNLHSLFPEAELAMIQYPIGPDGTRYAKATQGYNEMYMIPKTEVNDEARVREIVGFMDKMWSEEVQNLMSWGLEGVNYKVENGRAVVTDPNFGSNPEDLFQLRLDDGKKAIAGEQGTLIAEVKRLQTESESFAVFNPAQGLVSETFNEKGSQLERDVEDVIVQFLIGAIDEAEVDKAVQNWLNLGGAKILEEYNAAYKAAK